MKKQSEVRHITDFWGGRYFHLLNGYLIIPRGKSVWIETKLYKMVCWWDEQVFIKILKPNDRWVISITLVWNHKISGLFARYRKNQSTHLLPQEDCRIFKSRQQKDIKRILKKQAIDVVLVSLNDLKKEGMALIKMIKKSILLFKWLPSTAGIRSRCQ